jgi:uncharacterized protein with ParB-like and HNH nuclease domain
MKPRLRRDTNTITIASFWENFLLNKYDFDPPYQRKSVWTEEKQSFFIDSILRNFPIPPVFLQQKIDNATGKTRYELIDGKQRLTAIVKFIKGEIACSSELADEGNEGDEIAGKYFADFDAPELADYKSHFWRYSLPIEYIDTDSKKLIDDIFDRLNRNGEPLTGQELRNAQFHDTAFSKLVNDKAKLPFWITRLENLDLSRMEDREFIAEALFVILKDGPQHANADEIDSLYEHYCSKDFDFSNEDLQFDVVTKFLDDLKLDFEGFKIKGPSHLYGLWCFAHYCVSINIKPDSVADKLRVFFTSLRARLAIDSISNYRASMSARTKDKGQRQRRLDALKTFCGV